MAQKLNVVNDNFGGAWEPVGLIDPKVGMWTDKGIISNITGDVIKTTGLEYGTHEQYAHQLFVKYSHATGTDWSYPTGDGGVTYGTGLYPFRDLIVASLSGAYTKGKDAKLFS